MKGDTATVKVRRCAARAARSSALPECLHVAQAEPRPRAQIPELELEIPTLTQRGTMTTVRLRSVCAAELLLTRAASQVEGVLSNAARDLRLLQAERGAADPDLAGARGAGAARL